MGSEPEKQVGASAEPTEDLAGSEPKKEAGASASTESAGGDLAGSKPGKEAGAPRSPRRGSRASKSQYKGSWPDWI